MSLLVETIKILNGRVYNLHRHQERFDRARKTLFGLEPGIKLRKCLEVPSGFEKGLVKCRILYGRSIEELHFEKYHLRPIRTLKPVHIDTVRYDHKMADREELDRLFGLREGCDDILIIRKGLLTDSYYCNVALYDGEHWYSPVQPLLAGTQCARLLDLGRIRAQEIRYDDLRKFSRIRLFNAMISFGQIDLSTENICR